MRQTHGSYDLHQGLGYDLIWIVAMKPLQQEVSYG